MGLGSRRLFTVAWTPFSKLTFWGTARTDAGAATQDDRVLPLNVAVADCCARLVLQLLPDLQAKPLLKTHICFCTKLLLKAAAVNLNRDHRLLLHKAAAQGCYSRLPSAAAA